MKLSRIALAMLAAAPLVANAGVVITPILVGYTFQDSRHNNSWAEHLTNGPELQDDLFVGGALGIELTPWLSFEAEYNQVKGDVDGALPGAEYKQTQINGNFIATSDLFTKNYDSKIKPYVLLGAGHSKVKAQGTADFAKHEGTIANAGVGAFWRLNDVLSVRTEARGTYNEAVKNWNYTALAGLNVVLGGHLKPAAAPVVVIPVVPAPIEQPQELTEDLNMELRVFFDKNNDKQINTALTKARNAHEKPSLSIDQEKLRRRRIAPSLALPVAHLCQWLMCSDQSNSLYQKEYHHGYDNQHQRCFHQCSA